MFLLHPQGILPQGLCGTKELPRYTPWLHEVRLACQEAAETERSNGTPPWPAAQTDCCNHSPALGNGSNASHCIFNHSLSLGDTSPLITLNVVISWIPHCQTFHEKAEVGVGNFPGPSPCTEYSEPTRGSICIFQETLWSPAHTRWPWSLPWDAKEAESWGGHCCVCFSQC